MSEGLNRVMLLGNLGADPELRFTQGGSAVLNIRLATTEVYIDKSRERQERTEWHSVVVWGKRAEGLAKVLGKGSTIHVEGSLRNSSYEDRDGNKRYKTEIVASKVILCGGGPARAHAQDARPAAPSGGYSRGPAGKGPPPPEAPDDVGEEPPF